MTIPSGCLLLLTLGLISPLCAEQPGAVSDPVNFRVTVKKLDTAAATQNARNKNAISVHGAVMKPAEIDAAGDISVAEAIQAAGGLSPLAVNSWIRILSPSDGLSMEYRWATPGDNFRSPEGVAVLGRIVLRKGDQLTISEAYY